MVERLGAWGAIGVAVVAAALAGAFAAEQGVTAQAIVPDGELLAIGTGGVGTPPDVWFMTPDGGVVNVTGFTRPMSDADTFQGATALTWSPDGSTLAFLAPDHAIEGATGVYTVDRNGVVRYVESGISDGVSSPRWTPDGDLFYVTGRRAVLMRPLRDPIERTLDADPDLGGVSLSPDGRTALIPVYDERPPLLRWDLQRDRIGPLSLTHPSLVEHISLGADQDRGVRLGDIASWAHDGRRLGTAAYGVTDFGDGVSSSTELNIVDIRTGRARPITAFDCGSGDGCVTPQRVVGWSDDDRRVVLLAQRDRDGAYATSLWSVPVKGRFLRTDDPSVKPIIEFADNGSCGSGLPLVCYAWGGAEEGAVVVPDASGQAIEVPDSAGSAHALSPDGSRIAFAVPASDGSGQQIVIEGLDGSGRQVFDPLFTATGVELAWSPSVD